MNISRARVLAGRWFILWGLAVATHVVLNARHISKYDYPIQIVEAVALVFGWRHVGWIDGYRAALKPAKKKASPSAPA